MSSTTSSSPQGHRPASAPPPVVSPQLRRATQRVTQLQQTKPVSSWSSIAVGDWLDVLGFSQYRKTFISRSIDGEVLLSMTPDDYDHVGVRNLGHQKRIIGMVGLLRDQAFNAEEVVKEIPRKKTLGELARRKLHMERRSGLLGDFARLLDDVEKQLVELRKQFNNVAGYFEDILGAGEEDLMEQARNGIVLLKEKVVNCEDLVTEEWDQLHVDARKALPGGNLNSNRSSAELWSGLMAELAVPIKPPTPKKAKSEKEIEEVVQRFYGAQHTLDAKLRFKAQEQEKERKKMATAKFVEGKIIGSTLDIYDTETRKQKHDAFMARHWQAHLDSLKK